MLDDGWMPDFFPGFGTTNSGGPFPRNSESVFFSHIILFLKRETKAQHVDGAPYHSRKTHHESLNQGCEKCASFITSDHIVRKTWVSPPPADR